MTTEMAAVMLRGITIEGLASENLCSSSSLEGWPKKAL